MISGYKVPAKFDRFMHRFMPLNSITPFLLPQVGLPEGPIIYACSNQLYKYDPETFDTWARILHRVPNSVLWLLRFPPYGEHHIHNEAAARGIDPARVIFTDVAAKPVGLHPFLCPVLLPVPYARFACLFPSSTHAMLWRWDVRMYW